jgi:hypothetical protein
MAAFSECNSTPWIVIYPEPGAKGVRRSRAGSLDDRTAMPDARPTPRRTVADTRTIGHFAETLEQDVE